MRSKRYYKRGQLIRHKTALEGQPKRKEKKRRTSRHKCPVHGVRLVTRSGATGDPFEVCPEAGCQIRCAGGSTSTPCDNRTSRARRRTHDLFDPLWLDGPERMFHTRNTAYRWLAKVMRLTLGDCHIGMFDYDQCQTAQAAVLALTSTQRST